MTLDPIIAIHLYAALTATATGPVAIFARRTRVKRPKLHRFVGFLWVFAMLVTALSALFIQADRGPRLGGFSPIHLLVPITLYSLYLAFHYLRKRDIARHAQVMQSLYFGACIVAGLFTLHPQRFLGR